jgi:glycosyltransferase involved in cell wall biosynthesis
MRILLCNKYFFLNGGTEKYLQDLLRQLPVDGHEPIPFSVRYSNSWESPYNRYFLQPPGSPDEMHYRNVRLGALNWIRYLDRAVYSLEARVRLSKLIADVGRMDIAYLLNIYNYMSPSIVHTLKHHRIPVVLQLGDYHLVCPSYLLLRNGRPCTLCVKGSYYHGLRYRCVKNSTVASAVRVAAMTVQRLLRLYRNLDAFVVPCLFMGSILVQAGFPPSRIHLIPYPVFTSGHSSASPRKNYILYFGRITYEKGLDTLIGAYQRAMLAEDLVIMGRSYDGEEERLRKLIRPEWKDRIRFIGFKTGEEFSRWVAEALFTVVPSRWYDNAPISIYESMSCETPVLASRIGGTPEQIVDGITGRLFDPDSEADLCDGLRWMASDRQRLRKMGEAGRAFVLDRHAMEKHLGQLLDLFRSVIENSRCL